MLSQNDLNGISGFLQQIYAPCTPDELSSRILQLIPTVIPSEIPIHCFVDHQDRTTSFIASPDYLNIVGRVIENCDDHPFFHYFVRNLQPKPCLISDLMDESELHQLEGTYHSYLRPLGMEEQMAIFLPPFQWKKPLHRLMTDGISLHRSHRSFTERDRLVSHLLHPHLLQARQNAIAFVKAQDAIAQGHHMLELVGVITLAADGSVQLITQQAAELLSRYFFTPIQQFPDTLKGWFCHQVALMHPNGEMPSPWLPLQIEQDGKRLTIRLIYDYTYQQYLMLVEERKLHKFSIETLQLLGLTQREAEILFWVAKDKTNAEISKLVDCRSGTVRKHLEHIFHKLNVQTRTAAVMKALEQLGLFIWEK